ncbi:unnamed protein product [Victoria cruziana]
MGSSLREILDNVCNPKIFLSFPNEKEKKKISSKENAILEFYQKFACVGSDLVFSKKDWPRNMNQRLNHDIPQNNTFLLPRDVLATADHLIGMKFGMGTLDDMNHLKNKCICSVVDLLQDQFGLALVRLESMVQGTICGAIRYKLILTPRNLVTSTPLTTTYESFFGLHPLSQVLDRTNPLTKIVHGRKSSYLGPGGLTRQTASFYIRDIHPSHYGRICPIDTSEGINIGLIESLAIHARVGDWGSIETPFYEISGRSKEEQMVYLSPSRDEYYMVAAENSLALNRGLQEEEIHLRNIYPFQYFSIGASLIPFIEHNDANKALVSSNMQHQAVPLSQSEKYIVGTDLECQAALDSGGLAIVECEGNIIYTDAEKIILSSNGDTISISLVMYQRSNKNTWMHQKPQVHWVAYMPWDSYNSEDVVLINEHLVYDNIYTSFHIQKYEIQTYVTSQEPERITNEIPHLEPYLLCNLDRNGIVMLGTWVETGDILVGPEKGGSIYNPEMIRVYISQKRKIKVGNKVAGRHGNKGIISKNFPRQDMPYLQDGIPVDIVFNPLGIPSRMNVGQIHYRITPFDERYEQEVSRKLVFSKLYEANNKSMDSFDQPVIIGTSYMLKLIHQVDDKIHGHSIGHYALVTQQPLRGRAKQGGQRVGEMKVWALEGFGVAHILQEMLTYKSDHISAHRKVFGTMTVGGTIPNPEVIWGEKEPKFCEQCRVESVDFWIRRYQMGYIKLACPVTHVWYLKYLPSYIMNLLNKPLKELEGLVYCDV